MNLPIVIFPWSDNFDTGIELIDAQHRQLVELLNQLVSHLAYESDAPSINAVFDALKNYTVVHFRDEEAIWASSFGDDIWLQQHHDGHEDFVAKVIELKAQEGRKPLDEILEEIVTFLTHWLALHILESDKRLASVVRALSSGVSLDKAKVLADQELSGATRVLIDTVMSMYDKLAGRTVALTREIQRRRQAEQEMRLAKAEAERANQAKSRFLANMSHEIRTPIGAITGLALLIKRSGVSGRQAEWLDKIDASGRHLLDLINDILDLSKVEAGKLQLEQEPFAPATVIANVLRMLSEQARAKDLRLVLESAPLPPQLIGDATRLQQALTNYVSNAIKFTTAGSVTVRCSIVEDLTDEMLIRFEVRDTGIGISPQSLDRLFVPFEQADMSTSRSFGGTGLGLAITRGLAQSMGGAAGAASEPGRGSMFWFTARLKKPQRVEAPVPGPAYVESAESVLARDHRGRHVLLADDEPINREVMSSLLTDVGLVVDEAPDGERALELATQRSYDLILMDMQMPRLNGLDAARGIRKLPRGEATPIVAITANAFEEDRKLCLDAGMNDFITKPVHPDRLFATLLKWLAQPRGH